MTFVVVRFALASLALLLASLRARFRGASRLTRGLVSVPLVGDG